MRTSLKGKKEKEKENKSWTKFFPTFRPLLIKYLLASRHKQCEKFQLSVLKAHQNNPS